MRRHINNEKLKILIILFRYFNMILFMLILMLLSIFTGFIVALHVIQLSEGISEIKSAC